ncbi:MAG TPA: PDZ domain-containing protein [Trueperaceae bacterium]
MGTRLLRPGSSWLPTLLRLSWYAALLAIAALFASSVPASYRLLSSGTVGVLLKQDLQGRVALQPIPGRPAASAGVRAGDVLLAVDGEPVGSSATAALVARMRGAPGEPMTLTVERADGGTADVELVRTHPASERLGISPRTYALILIVVGALFVAAYIVPAGIIALRRPDNWVAALVWLTLVLIAVFNSRANAALTFADGPLGLAVTAAYHVAVLLVLLVFPDGRLSPRWARWYLFVGLAWIAFKVAPLPASYALMATPFWVLIDFLVFGIAVTAQVARFRRSTDPAARQQTKWLVYGLVTAFLVQYAYYIPLEFVSTFQSRSVYEFAGSIVNHVLMLGVPVAFTYAVLRHRLYDIDLIINRTLVYVPLTAILAGVFAASVTLLRGLFDSLLGASSGAAPVLSSILVVALLTPVKDALQKAVDARFGYSSRADRALKDLEAQVTSRLHEVDAGPAMRRLLEHAVRAFDAVGGAAELEAGGESRTLGTVGVWTGESVVTVPVETSGRTFGCVRLAARRRGAAYLAADVERLRAAAAVVATAIAEDREE